MLGVSNVFSRPPKPFKKILKHALILNLERPQVENIFGIHNPFCKLQSASIESRVFDSMLQNRSSFSLHIINSVLVASRAFLGYAYYRHEVDQVKTFSNSCFGKLFDSITSHAVTHFGSTPKTNIDRHQRPHVLSTTHLQNS